MQRQRMDGNTRSSCVSAPLMVSDSKVVQDERTYAKFWLVPLILALENTAVVQIPHPWFTVYLYRGVPIVLGFTLLLFGRSTLSQFKQEKPEISRKFVLLHLAILGSLAVVELYLLRFYSSGSTHRIQFAVAFWLILLGALVVTLLRVFLPFRRWGSIIVAFGPAWLYAGLCSAAVVVFREFLRLSWDHSSRLGRELQDMAFAQTRELLHLVYPTIVSDSADHIVGTSRFVVQISGTCSGMEGIALMTGVMLFWFILARKEIKLPRALVLVPLALGLMWLLNLVRLVALISIGTAGYPGIAINGFHSEAGWITFTIASVAFVWVAQSTAWLQKPGFEREQPTAIPSPHHDVATAYLAPFLAITAASLVSKAAAENFEWLYPLRFIAAIAALWICRTEYRKLNWSFGLLGTMAGIVVGAIWIAWHYALVGWAVPSALPLRSGLAGLSSSRRTVWIVFRVLAACLTVPVAEELAFRGFLARRFMSGDVDGVPFSRLSTSAILLSSLAFGLMHGNMWAVGAIAGLIFAMTARMSGRLGESVAAHAIANAVIASFVLVRGDYSLW